MRHRLLELFRAATIPGIALICALACAPDMARADGGGNPDTSSMKNLRDTLADWGVTFSFTYIAETLGNPAGGIRRGTIFTGRLDAGVDVDLEKVAGWTGAKFHANIFQIHGQGLSRDYIGNLMLVSGVESLPSTRLYEIWIEQSLFDGRLLVRVGQQASDIEFIDSKYDDIFANSALGWPGITGINLLAGGPSPPLAVPGLRVKAQITDSLAAYAAIFDGDAAPPDSPLDPQLANPHGLLFRINDPPWIIGQLKYRFDAGADGLPGVVSGGAWTHLGQFDDQRFAVGGGLLADPNGTGEPRSLRGNQGIFGVYEQLLMRAAPGSEKGIGFFVRSSISPSDRNLISFYIDGGLQFSGFSASRPNDRLGLAMTYARISSAARRADRDVLALTGVAMPVRDYEAVFEATYMAEVRSNWMVQPVFQYVLHPGGGAVDPRDPSRIHRIKDAVVFGLRSTISF